VIHLVLVSPTLALRVGLRALLDAADDLAVVGEAASIDSPELDVAEADVIVLASAPFTPTDLEDVQRAAVAPLAVLALAGDPADAEALAGLHLRAWGVLPLDVSEEELFAAVRALHEGLIVGAPSLIEPLIGPRSDPDGAGDDLIDPLTPREAEVLQLLAQGLANKQIARELEISEHTVKFHISSIYTKLWATNRAEAVRVGIQRGLIAL